MIAKFVIIVVICKISNVLLPKGFFLLIIRKWAGKKVLIKVKINIFIKKNLDLNKLYYL